MDSALGFHVTQSIWLSGWTAYSGDLSDARFNNLVLEHDYLALRSHYQWFSPGQFYPTPATLGLSENHFGTFLIYGLFTVCCG